MFQSAVRCVRANRKHCDLNVRGVLCECVCDAHRQTGQNMPNRTDCGRVGWSASAVHTRCCAFQSTSNADVRQNISTESIVGEITKQKYLYFSRVCASLSPTLCGRRISISHVYVLLRYFIDFGTEIAARSLMRRASLHFSSWSWSWSWLVFFSFFIKLF